MEKELPCSGGREEEQGCGGVGRWQRRLLAAVVARVGGGGGLWPEVGQSRLLAGEQRQATGGLAGSKGNKGAWLLLLLLISFFLFFFFLSFFHCFFFFLR